MKHVVFAFLFLFNLVSCQAQTSGKKGSEPESTVNRLQLKADSAFTYCKANKMDTTFCILIDMKIHSGKNRIFVWDFAGEKILYTGLCCHGVGGESTGSQPVFSNKPGSNCTSLGKYKIGISSYSQWGINIHYKLHGLEKTNNKAFERIVVLHSHKPVPSREIYPFHLPLGWSLGCPVVSDDMMRNLDYKLKGTKRSVLLWIYY